MTYIVLDDQQAQIVAEAKGIVALHDKTGKLLGYVAHGFTDEEITVAKRRLAASGPRYTTAEVLEHLQGLAQ